MLDLDFQHGSKYSEYRLPGLHVRAAGTLCNLEERASRKNNIMGRSLFVIAPTEERPQDLWYHTDAKKRCSPAWRVGP